LTTNLFDPRPKIVTVDVAVRWRRQQGKVVFTNGVFDLLHAGHIDVLVAARALGDALVVGVNTDASVRRLKGPSRPVRLESDRAYVLAALEVVDAVVLFDEDTPLELIRALAPDVLVKGGDYSSATVVGAPDVTARGGDVVIIPLTPGHSTTSTVERMRTLEKEST
jgi:rfaE bifunctional protein nucleotidyltransferase chain/domain